MLYLLKRLVQMVAILAALSMVLFGLLSAMPGNPVDMLITSNPNIKPQDVIRLKKLRGLDKPWYVQYVRWMWGYHEPIRPVEFLDLPVAQVKQGRLELDMKPYLSTLNGKTIRLEGILGSHVDHQVITAPLNKTSPCVWFKAVDAVGLEQVGCAVNPLYRAGVFGVKEIPSQVVDDPDSFKVDLASFVNVDNTKTQLHFKLLNSPGSIDKNGVYRHVFSSAGQTVVQFQVWDDFGHQAQAAFAVEQGPIGDPNKFSPGFLYFFTGNKEALGFSNAYKRSIWELLMGAENEEDAGAISAFIASSGRIGNTLQLMIPALLVALLIALPLGVLSAYRQYSWLDYIVNFFAFVGISLPVFWFAIMVMYLLAERFQLLPAGGMQTPGIDESDAWLLLRDRVVHAILPVGVLSIAYIGRFMRYMRAAMLEVLPSDYIRTARAKGLKERAVVLKHALRNALIPIVTILTLSIPALFGGAVLTETVFSWPGIGRLEYDAVVNSDYYVAIVVFLISSALVMLGNLAADVLYVLVDPRIRKVS